MSMFEYIGTHFTLVLTTFKVAFFHFQSCLFSLSKLPFFTFNLPFFTFKVAFFHLQSCLFSLSKLPFFTFKVAFFTFKVAFFHFQSCLFHFQSCLFFTFKVAFFHFQSCLFSLSICLFSLSKLPFFTTVSPLKFIQVEVISGSLSIISLLLVVDPDLTKDVHLLPWQFRRLIVGSSFRPHKASASRAENPGFEFRLRSGDFSGLSHKYCHSSGYPVRRLAL